MMRVALATVVSLVAGSALAQSAPTITSAPQSGGASGSAVKKLLIDNYEIKTAFSDNNGGAYILLQKATSAYLCHSGINPSCEKLN